jgi:hypothetical protein
MVYCDQENPRGRIKADVRNEEAAYEDNGMSYASVIEVEPVRDHDGQGS